MRLYVGNLNYRTTEDMLREKFGEFGEVVSSVVISERDTGRSKGFGFVEMSNAEQGQAAIEAMDGTELDGRPLKVNEARPRVDRGF